ncbi:hypothetical protein TREMEDRAFT_24381 [Tremella mesenterica DSM 1558]|uniref:uncharacterized protein n=1 Tax=Tremella mesenterica (strain ATCC 24925 / CBS 8224 / DSM 1558 / NBRC 9311 / NRRL Y-6157 / RJB 2259-6 / UBC 559-6) TaxID=578456 RepID=UPI0003F49660|nr:uncharacterized protein TREMEDRAFT_24381 [Tremella mesenterica DSM 1558]EIW73650.1 hypothetical protein TREMEDRAFT_24381 [Tremella mesenterica DSM 1558]
MSFPVKLRPQARSAYRAVLRATKITFNGDEPRKIALRSLLRQTFSSPTLTPPSQLPQSSASRMKPDSQPQSTSKFEELNQRIEEWKEVALFIRKNVVQGVKDEQGTFRLRLTSETELGDNTTIRDPPKLPNTPFPRGRKKDHVQ